MKKSTLAITATVVVLMVMIIVLAALNDERAQELAARQDDATFVIRTGGEVFTVDFQTLQEAGIRTFTATRRGGGATAAQVSFQGVPLTVLCGWLGIDLSNVGSVVALAADGFSSVVSGDQARDMENVFIATAENGIVLAKRDEGGDGPYMLVVAKDTFSQNWCKFLSELIIR
jgi:hypothetical protein